MLFIFVLCGTAGIVLLMYLSYVCRFVSHMVHVVIKRVLEPAVMSHVVAGGAVE